MAWFKVWISTKRLLSSFFCNGHWLKSQGLELLVLASLLILYYMAARTRGPLCQACFHKIIDIGMKQEHGKEARNTRFNHLLAKTIASNTQQGRRQAHDWRLSMGAPSITKPWEQLVVLKSNLGKSLCISFHLALLSIDFFLQALHCIDSFHKSSFPPSFHSISKFSSSL